MGKNEIKNFIKDEKERIYIDLNNKLSNAKADKNDILSNDLQLKIDISDLNIHFKFLIMQDVKKNIQKLFKKIYGFNPTNIEYRFSDESGIVHYLVFTYTDQIFNEILQYDLYVFGSGFILGILFLQLLYIIL